LDLFVTGRTSFCVNLWQRLNPADPLFKGPHFIVQGLPQQPSLSFRLDDEDLPMPAQSKTGNVKKLCDCARWACSHPWYVDSAGVTSSSTGGKSSNSGRPVYLGIKRFMFCMNVGQS